MLYSKTIQLNKDGLSLMIKKEQLFIQIKIETGYLDNEGTLYTQYYTTANICIAALEEINLTSRGFQLP